MKGITVFFLTVGLASAQANPAPIAVNGGPVDPNALNSSSISLGNVSDTSEINSGGAAGANLNLGSGLGASGDSSSSLVNPNTNLQGLDASGLNLGSGLDLGNGLNLGSGLDLGSLDFNNQADILNAIQLMMNSLCLGGLVQEVQLQQLGQAAQVEMLLELAQLMSLMQAGLINLSEIQGLSAAGLLFSGFNIAGVLRRELGTNGRVCSSHKPDKSARMETHVSHRLRVDSKGVRFSSSRLARQAPLSRPMLASPRG